MKGRPGAYAVAHDETGTILCVRFEGRLFLPGGGIDWGETPAEAVLRELREETGRTGAIRCSLGVRAEDFPFPPFRKIGHFFEVALGDTTGCGEADHTLVWLAPADAREALADAYQVWAVERYAADSAYRPQRR